MPAVRKRPAAESDLEELAIYLGHSDPTLADRFLSAAERTMIFLSRMPRLGAPFLLSNPRLRNLRHHPIQGFPKHIVSYLPTDLGIEVIRVLHGARDLHTLLAGKR